MENKNGQGIFYGVIGVATLVVAIIGATFAYFSASAAGNGANIEGSTDNVGGALALEVTKVAFSGATATYTGLVPAVIDASDETGVNAALTKKCEDGSYTGCHVYEISATSSTAVSSGATIELTLTGPETHTNWKYLVYDGVATAADNITHAATAFNATGENIYTGGLSTTAVKRYLMIYIDNVSGSQNQGSTDETGNYTGSVVLKSAGGEVKATLTA